MSIVRARNPPPPGAIWEMTEIDQANAFMTLRGTWVFDRALDVDRLRDGLASVLDGYPHLAGRRAGPRGVALDNAGVPLVVASRGSLSVNDVIAEPSLGHRLAGSVHPLLQRLGYEPLLRVKVTALREGTVLSVCASHGCVDGRTFYAFVQSWGRACAGRAFPKPVLDPTRIPPRSGRSKDEALRAATELGWKRVGLGTLLGGVALSASGRLTERVRAATLSPAALRRLRTTVAREAGLPAVRTYVALAAQLSAQCVRLHGLAPETRCTQVSVLDARCRLPQVPAAYAGNAVFLRSAGFAAGATLGEMAACIARELEPYAAIPSPRLAEDLVLARELVSHRLLMMPYDLAGMYARRPTVIYVNDFSVMPVYEVDFGVDGAPVTPVRVIPHDLPDPVLIWPAPPSQGGVEVYLAGAHAQALRTLPRDDPWWDALHRIEEGPGGLP